MTMAIGASRPHLTGSKSSGHGRSWEVETSLIASMDCWLASPDCSHLIALEREEGINHATTKRSNHVSLISGAIGHRGGRQVGREMNAPRVSDEELEDLWKAVWLAKRQTRSPQNFAHHEKVQWALMDLKDARDQLKTHQEMRDLYNKEPE